MLTLIKCLIEGKLIAGILSALALFFANVGAHACCFFIFHEPEKPDLSKLRNF